MQTKVIKIATKQKEINEKCFNLFEKKKKKLNITRDFKVKTENLK